MNAISASFMAFPALFAASHSSLSLMSPVLPAGADEDGAEEAESAVGADAPLAGGVEPAVVAGAFPPHAARAIREMPTSTTRVGRESFTGGHDSRCPRCDQIRAAGPADRTRRPYWSSPSERRERRSARDVKDPLGSDVFRFPVRLESVGGQPQLHGLERVRKTSPAALTRRLM